MNQFLTRSEVDKLLGEDPAKRPIKAFEFKLLREAIEKTLSEKGTEILSDDELEEILKRLSLEHVEIRKDL